ncbi:MAG: hypothetical protein K2N63_09315, partial [Lachnospiraceae bacterium]|nr:hypothetical protein [Lachnospiraceae bacterium]
MGKKFTAICVLAAFLLLPAAGCGREKLGEEQVTGIPSDVPQQTKEPSQFPIEVTEITYYTLSEDLETVEVTSVLAGSVDMGPRELAEYVAGTMGDVSVTVSIRDVTVEDTKLVVDFEEDSVPARYANSRLESAILDALSQSLLDHFTDYSGIIFRVGGKAYQSENRTFESDYVYMG